MIYNQIQLNLLMNVYSNILVTVNEFEMLFYILKVKVLNTILHNVNISNLLIFIYKNYYKF